MGAAAALLATCASLMLLQCCLAQKPSFRTMYQWRQIEYEYPSQQESDAAVSSGSDVPINVIPLGVERWRQRVFVSTPRWRRGVPATLSSLTLPGREVSTDVSPKLRPYPDWNINNPDNNCTGLTSVFRMSIDPCGRMWVLDSGQVDAFENLRQLCPPQVVVFDLETDEVLARYPIPSEFVLQNSLITNIIVDSRDNQCSDLHLYISDAWRFGLIVFRASDAKFWRFTHHTFYPDPLLSNYTLHELNYQWQDGLFGMSLSPNDGGDRTLYYHAMSSSLEFYVSTSVIRDPDRVSNAVSEFRLLGDSRGTIGQVSAAAVDRNGIMFFNLISQDSIGCWDTRKPYTLESLGVVARDNVSLVFPNDLRLDYEKAQRGWLITNRLPMFQFNLIRPEDINYRLLYFDTNIVKGSVCDPDVKIKYSKPHGWPCYDNYDHGYYHDRDGYHDHDRYHNHDRYHDHHLFRT